VGFKHQNGDVIAKWWLNGGWLMNIEGIIYILPYPMYNIFGIIIIHGNLVLNRAVFHGMTLQV
jgi:hypothetical protein